MLSKRYLINFLPLVLILILASILRLWQLGSVPISMSDDEIRLVYSGYSIAQSGKDAFGNIMPLVFNIDGASTYGQIPIYLTSIFFLFLPLDPFTARLPFALSGILSVFLIYLIARNILKNDKIALPISFVLSVSVWCLQLSRFAIEIDVSIALFLAGITLFLYSGRGVKLFLASMIVFFLAFHAYSATKILFIPIFGILLWYRFKELGKQKMVMMLLTILISFTSYAYLSVKLDASNYSSAGGAPFFFMDKQGTALTVELERRASDKPQFTETIYHNKVTYWFRTFSTNYLTAYSPQFLFLNQEANSQMSIWGRGEMYIFELPLLILGVFYLFIKRRREFYLISMFLLISPLPSALGVNSPTWMARSGFMIIWLSFFTGTGIYGLSVILKKQIYKYLAYAILVIFYIFSIGGYLSQYYYDWSRTNADAFSKSTKDLISKINDYNKQGKKVIISGATENTFMHYAFYNKLDPRLVQENIGNTPIKFANFTLQEDCLLQIPADVVYISPQSCEHNATPSAEIKAYNGPEVVWSIYENK